MGGGGCNARLSKPCLCVRPKYLIFPYPFPALVPVVQRADNFIQWISHYPAVQMYSKQRFWQVFHTIPYLACVSVVSLSFQPSGASTKDARGHWAKRSKKVGAGGRGGEGKETPAAEPRHFTERPQMALLPWGLHCHFKCHMRTNHF